MVSRWLLSFRLLGVGEPKPPEQGHVDSALHNVITDDKGHGTVHQPGSLGKFIKKMNDRIITKIHFIFPLAGVTLTLPWVILMAHVKSPDVTRVIKLFF
jgi:hypothetical protein